MSSTLAFATSRAPVARVASREAEPRCATVSAADRARAMPTRATTSAAGIPSAKSGFAGPRTLKAPTRRDRAVAGSIPPGAGGDVSDDVSDASRARSRLVLYTKPGCCLCEGLEEKLGEIFRGGAGAASGDALRALEFETRDVSTNETWARKHASEVPAISFQDRYVLSGVSAATMNELNRRLADKGLPPADVRQFRDLRSGDVSRRGHVSRGDNLRRQPDV